MQNNDIPPEEVITFKSEAEANIFLLQNPNITQGGLISFHSMYLTSYISGRSQTPFFICVKSITFEWIMDVIIFLQHLLSNVMLQSISPNLRYSPSFVPVLNKLFNENFSF
jgi:hypothetical protein